MLDRKKHHSVSIGSPVEPPGSVSMGYACLSSLVLGAALLAAAANGSSSTARESARLAVTWSVARGDHVYHLRGRYSIAGVDEAFATSIASDASSPVTSSEVAVPAGLYRVTLEAGYTLERSVDLAAGEASESLAGSSVEQVPASLLSLNPVLVSVEEGGTARLGLSLVDMPGTAPEPESTCMNGS